MNLSLSTLNELVQRFDRDFFCKKTGDGVLRVYHNKFVMRPYEVDGTIYNIATAEPYHVFSLTDTWMFNGRRADWGYLPVYFKLCSLEDPNSALKFIESEEEKSRSKESRRVSNLAGDMAYEMRDAVKKDTKDVLTHSVKKMDKRRIYDKRIKGV
jgi:hypothetical protein